MTLKIQDIIELWERHNRYPEEIRRIEEKYRDRIPSEFENIVNSYTSECCDVYFKFGFQQAIAFLTAEE